MLLRDLLMARPCFPKIQGFFYTCKKTSVYTFFIPSLISKKKKTTEFIRWILAFGG